MVGALLCEPCDPSCAAGVIFFNNAGYLGMCGHGLIGVAVTLHRLGRIGLGIHRVETPVGSLSFNLLDPNTVRFENVPSYRYRKGVALEVEGLGEVQGDIAWGGNWFFLVNDAPVNVERQNLDRLITTSRQIKDALAIQGITGEDEAEIDHVEFFRSTDKKDVDSVNFVMCPGGEYDRSPCGTGTSAKIACLAAEGRLAEGEKWVQESVCGGRFEASYRLCPAVEGAPLRVQPTITGRAFVCSEATLINEPKDPFGHNLPQMGS